MFVALRTMSGEPETLPARMNIAPYGQAVKFFALIFLICFGISLNCGFAATIDQTAGDGALVLNGDGGSLNPSALNLYGSPLEYYSFGQTPLYFGPFPPPDTLGAAPGAFLVTGNTFYNFTGDPTLAVYQLNLGPAIVSAVTQSEPSVVPEPRANQLFAAALFAMLLAAGYRASKSGTVPGSPGSTGRSSSRHR